MIKDKHFLKLYKYDLDNMMNIIRNKFNIINYEYYCKLMKDFPLDLNGYIEYSLTLDENSKIRFFFVYYNSYHQDWIKHNLDNILKENVFSEQYEKVNKAVKLFDKIDSNGFFTYGADITSSYFKLYFVSNKLNNSLKEIADFFQFPFKELTDFNMIGLNIYKDKIDIKLYLVYNSPSQEEIFKNYKQIYEIEHWDKYINRIETFISIMPQYDYRSTIAFPTLFNNNCKKKLKDLPQSRGLFLDDNVYPSWLGFNEKAKLNIIYFRPKRDYIFKGDNNDIVFKDKDFKDYERNG